MIVMVMIVEKLHHEKDFVMQRHTQAGNITTNHKVKVYFISPAISSMYVVKWKFLVDDSAKGRYDPILGRYLLDRVQTKMPPTISFSGMYQKLFIYRRNRTNSQ